LSSRTFKQQHIIFTLQMRCRNGSLHLQCGLSHRITKHFGPRLDLTTLLIFLFQYYTEFPQVEGSTIPAFRGRGQTAPFPEPHPLKMSLTCISTLTSDCQPGVSKLIRSTSGFLHITPFLSKIIVF